ncbi:MAG: outer membrane lipoprotein-sorting protein [Bacteroidales bacterium]|nr:outer membrane lipoprotein-sorting protein [Bacteroidales bacterium]
MKKILSLAAVLFSAAVLNAQTMTGRDVMQLVKDRPDGESRQSEMEMTLCKKNGKVRLRRITSWSIDDGPDTKKVMFFTYPGDVRGTGFLVWDYDEVGRDDDKWLYLPALKKTRRISGSSSKADYFMGTDFTYGDMGSRNVDEDTHQLLREEDRDGHRCWVVRSTPLDKREVYGYKVSWVRQDCAVPVYVEYYDKLDALQRVLTMSDIRQVQGFWTVHVMEMRNVQTGHSTTLKVLNPQYQVQVDRSLFTVNKLEQGL